MAPINRLRRPRSTLFALLALCVTAPAAAQDRVTATSGDPAVIAQIRARFAEIGRESSSYRQTTRDLHGFSLEGGGLKGFFRGAELRKLEARFYGEMWRAREEYYFAGDSLFFVYTVHEGYDQPLSGNVRVTVEHRYYFDGDRLIRRVVTKRPHDEHEWFTNGDSVPDLLARAKLLRACAAARSTDPPECSAPER
jgi:hypothetical protein